MTTNENYGNHNYFGTSGVINYREYFVSPEIQSVMHKRTSKLITFKIQNRSMIISIMNYRMQFFRMQPIKAQTRLKRLRTILP
jgi:hypothetical protein